MSIPAPIDAPFTAAIAAAAACMPLECPEPPEDPEEGYEPFGICNLMLKLALGSIAPFLPMLNVVLTVPPDLPGIINLPLKFADLPALPFEMIAGPDLPPIPIPDIGTIGGMDMPELPALGALVFGLLMLPIEIAQGLLSFKIPDLSFDGMLDLILPAIGAALKIPALMLPTLGLLDLAICFVALLLFPILAILGAMKPIIDAIGPAKDAGLDVPELPALPTEEEIEKMKKDMEEMTDEEKKAKGEAALARLVQKEQAEERAKRQAAMNASGDSSLKERKNKAWKPGIGDDFYG